MLNIKDTFVSSQHCRQIIVACSISYLNVNSVVSENYIFYGNLTLIFFLVGEWGIVMKIKKKKAVATPKGQMLVRTQLSFENNCTM